MSNFGKRMRKDYDTEGYQSKIRHYDNQDNSFWNNMPYSSDENFKWKNKTNNKNSGDIHYYNDQYYSNWKNTPNDNQVNLNWRNNPNDNCWSKSSTSNNWTASSHSNIPSANSNDQREEEETNYCRSYCYKQSRNDVTSFDCDSKVSKDRSSHAFTRVLEDNEKTYGEPSPSRSYELNKVNRRYNNQSIRNTESYDKNKRHKSFSRFEDNGVRRKPDRWDDYKEIGEQIPGTQFITFKTPLNNDYFEIDEEKFTPKKLLKKLPSMGIVINLTFKKGIGYYNTRDIVSHNIQYEHIRVPGREIPSDSIVKDFFSIVDTFIKKHKEKLVGVHCTHGLNRTGYMICRYMIERLGISPQESIDKFNDARGHRQERTNYIEHLISLKPINVKIEKTVNKNENKSTLDLENVFKNENKSPLDLFLTEAETNEKVENCVEIANSSSILSQGMVKSITFAENDDALSETCLPVEPFSSSTFQ